VSTSGKAINVRQLANSMLTAIVAHYATAEGQPLPDRRYVAPGENRASAWDCEQLTVSLGGIGWGQNIDAAPNASRRGTPTSVFAVRHAVLYAQLVRCIHVSDSRGQPPKVEDLQGDGDQFMLDAGLLSQAMVSWASTVDRTLEQDDPLNGSVQLGVVEGIGPSGKYVGAEVSAIVTCAGLEP
jgi:hypothetical protein